MTIYFRMCMMKNSPSFTVCFAFCLTVAMMWPGTLESNEYVDGASQCLECHAVDYGSAGPEELHIMHANNTCGSCHVIGAYQAGNVKAHKCTLCHPQKCDSAVTHESEHGADCLDCHLECNAGPTTTTSQPGDPCPAEELFGEQSDEVRILKAVRDNILSQTPEGREIIKMYYQWAPIVITAFRNDN